MSQNPCGRETCEFITEVFGEAESPEMKCLYHGADWETVKVDQSLECDPISMLAIHCQNIIDVKIIRSAKKKLRFHLHGEYNRPVGSDEIYMALQAPKDKRWLYSLILQGPGYLCEAFYTKALQLEVFIPEQFVFSAFVVSARSIQSPVMLKAKDRIRLTASLDIVCKVCTPKIWATAQTGVCLTCEAFDHLTEANISCQDYIEVTLGGFDSYSVISPIPQHYIRQKLRSAHFPAIFKGSVISATGDATICEQVFS